MKAHFFICQNIRSDGRDSCGQRGSEKLAQELKQKCRELIKQQPYLKEHIKVTKTLCLGRCAQGPVLVVYPQGEWHCELNEQKITDLFEQYSQKICSDN